MDFYSVDLFFYAVRLYVMTKNEWQMPERKTTSTMCHDEAKFYMKLSELKCRKCFYPDIQYKCYVY